MSSFSLSLPSIPSPARIRSSLFRVPLATKVVLLLIVLFWLATFLFGKQDWARLEPERGLMGSAHRLSTYPYLHLGLIHTLLNVLALTPLLEKFETENGTLVTALLFTGPFCSFPGILYILFCNLFHIKTPVQGASIWTFLLLSSALYRSSLTTPFLTFTPPTFSSSSPSTPYRIPTVLVPLLLILLTAALISGTSITGHCCGALIGFGWGSGVLKFLAPPEKILRWVEDKAGLRTRLPGSYVAVDKTVMGRYGVGAGLPVSEGIGLVGTGDGGRKLGV